jgi:hypothetical protein
MQQVIALTLFVMSVVFFVRNLYEMAAIVDLSNRVWLKLARLAAELEAVIRLNSEVIDEFKQNSDVTIVMAPEGPPSYEKPR